MAHDFSHARLEFHMHAWNFTCTLGIFHTHAAPLPCGRGCGLVFLGLGLGLGLVFGVEVGPKPRCWLEERILKDMSVFLDGGEGLRVGLALV